MLLELDVKQLKKTSLCLFCAGGPRAARPSLVWQRERERERERREKYFKFTLAGFWWLCFFTIKKEVVMDDKSDFL